MVTVLGRAWAESLISLVNSAQSRLVIAAPFVSEDGAKLIVDTTTSSFRQRGHLEILTDLSPAHVQDGSLSLDALATLQTNATRATLRHIPRFHAKVYIADDAQAIVTSGNLTAAAIHRNIEYGVHIADSTLIAAIQSEFDDYRETAAAMGATELTRYAAVAKEVRSIVRKRKETTDPRLARALEEALREAEDELVRFKLSGGTVHGVFTRTIEYLFRKHGPMSTPDLEERVKELHPDLCDDSIDRVVDGESFGRKWKHAARSAQQNLKRRGVIAREGHIWFLRG